MNCKPGDVAVIVAPYRDIPMRGLVCTVLRSVRGGEYIASKDGGLSHGNPLVAGWVVDGKDPRFPCCIADVCLKPLRDPGEDAQDETLAWLPVPAPAREVVHG